MGVMHEADDAYSIWSTWSCYLLDQFLTLALNTLIWSIFYISLDLSTIYFIHFSGCWASFVCNCHSILECCVMFSGVKLSIRSFNLLQCLSYGYLFWKVSWQPKSNLIPMKLLWKNSPDITQRTITLKMAHKERFDFCVTLLVILLGAW